MYYIPGFRRDQFSIPRYLLANVVLALIIAVFSTPGFPGDPKMLGIGFVWSFVISITIWTGCMLLTDLMDKRIKWMERPVLRSVLGIVVLVGYSLVMFMIDKLLLLYIFYGITPSNWYEFLLESSIYTVLISLFISLLFTAIGFFKAWKRETITSAQLKTQMMTYQYEALRNQINPHFLFNSLNVLSDLVYEDQQQAVRFIRQLSDLFRYVLDSRDKELVPLQEELNFLDSYIFLLKTRFEEKLQIDLQVEARSDDFMVPMTLQMLIENAVKHNEVSAAFPLKVTVRQNGDYLEVENNLQPKSVGDDSKKTGLQNIRQQFAFFSAKPVEIEQTEQFYRVRVPILKVEN
ncbi:sensor histidine kinase [Mangrovibacterium diazotrophicum]|uniref:Histidine kinase n=1 Tax=Mangrovibacterium diazotrophicum TaxID=1261403 RepID=A0A419W7X1_9BACT|nr:sensor histidine kinase [Mangrovibacterium diazotrophicum]RKD91559.1 histidine kinase [Mangrovibacterium diazotrophicum]